MLYTLASPNNCFKLTVTTFTWVQINNGAAILGKVRRSSTSTETVTFGNLPMDVEYTVTSDGTFGAVTPFLRDFGESAGEEVNIFLEDLYDVPPQPLTGDWVLETVDGALAWIDADTIRMNQLSWRLNPQFNGYIALLGWYLDSDTAQALTSAAPFTTTLAGFNAHFVFNVSNATGAPFTIRVTGKTVDDTTSVYTDEYEDISVTGNGYYQTSKSFIDAPQISIVEASKSCYVDVISTTYWDRGNYDFTALGCRFEWTPNTAVWSIHARILHTESDGSIDVLDDISFASTDTVPRAGKWRTGKYKRLDYDHWIRGNSGEGIVVEILDQVGIETFMFEVKIDAS